MDKVNVRVELSGELLEKFNAVKQDLGLMNNTEVVRALIKKYHGEIRNRNG
jgi:metal-responsive CopG/Arc/MetJ family transcriptional regulator